MDTGRQYFLLLRCVLDGLSYGHIFAGLLLIWSNLTNLNKIFKVIIELYRNIRTPLDI